MTSNKYEAVCGMKIGGGNRSTWKKSTPGPNFSSKIPSEKLENNLLIYRAESVLRSQLSLTRKYVPQFAKH
jgi:hypothetical protein